MGLSLFDQPVFDHGQLYVAISRVQQFSGVRVLNIVDKKPELKIKNIVYREMLDMRDP